MFQQLRRLFKQRPALELRVRELSTLLLLTPRAFEAAVADLLTEMGYKKVKVAGGPGDLAADITCRDPDGHSVIVQCKQYALGRTVGSKEIQLFLGMAFTHHKADKAIYVTTASYTAPAIELAARHRIELIDGDRLATLLLDLRGPAETDELEEDGLAELVARGIYDPGKVQVAAPAVVGPSTLIPGEVIALGLPKSCDSCGAEMEVRYQALGWTCPTCGSVEDWERDTGLSEWPERKVFHEFLAALNSGQNEQAASFFTRGAAVTYLSGPVQALRTEHHVREWLAAFPLILQPVTAWRSTGESNLLEICDAYDRASGLPVGQLTATTFVSVQDGRIQHLWTNPA